MRNSLLISAALIIGLAAPVMAQNAGDVDKGSAAGAAQPSTAGTPGPDNPRPGDASERAADRNGGIGGQASKNNGG